jgi:hypothetical protein
MLAGRPAYEYHLKKDEAVLKNVMGSAPEPTGRIDLKNIPAAAEKAISPQTNLRFPDVLSFVRALQPNFPAIPAEQKPFRVNWRMVFIVIGSLLAISLLMMFALATV